MEVTVYSLAGEKLLQSQVSSVSSLSELKQLAAELAEKSAICLNAKRCRLVSADGLCHSLCCVSSLTDPIYPITAVAEDVDPLLQLVGLQNSDGELLDESLQREELEKIALEIATSLAQIACWFGGPQHLAGLPRIPWKWSDTLPTPRRFQGKFLCVDHATPVVHSGAHITLSTEENSMRFPFVEAIRAERDLTVQDILQIRATYADLCNQNKPELLSRHPGADSIDAVMRLVRYTNEEVHFELGHRAYKLGD